MSPQTYPEFLATARAAADDAYAYPELVDDWLDQAALAYAEGEAPAAFVRRAGEKWNLTPRSAWTPERAEQFMSRFRKEA